MNSETTEQKDQTVAQRPRPWWRLSGVEIVGGMLGAAMGLVAAAPLLWLSAEAQRYGNPELSAAGQFLPLELLALWASGAVVGGFIAANLSRLLLHAQEQLGHHWALHLLHLLGGCVLIALVAPAPMAVILGLVHGGVRTIGPFYVMGGSLIGWQSGVIAFVFLYTFKLLDQVRRKKEESA